MVALEIRHPALIERVPARALSPERAKLNDRGRIGVLLQGAALLAHLDHGGWWLEKGFEPCRIDAQDRLVVPGASPGRGGRLPQSLLADLAQRLFRSDGEVAGRGQARRIVRALQKRWQQELAPQPADRLVSEILERAPFLWKGSFAQARLSLLSEQLSGGLLRPWIVGPGFFRRKLLGSRVDALELRERLLGNEAREAWRGTDRSPLELAEEGRWSAAVRVWTIEEPRDSQEKEAWATCLYNVGRFEDALAGVRGIDSFHASSLRLKCQYQLGLLDAARKRVRQLESKRLGPEQLVDVADVALRVCANQGDREAVRAWIGRLVQVKGRHATAARLLAAQGRWDLGDLGRMEKHLQSAAAAQDDPKMAWLYHQARALQAISSGDGGLAVEHSSLALAKSRRTLRPFEAGRLWNDLVLARVTADDLAGAERACLHSLRLLEGCDGPARTTLALYNLAELRIRRGHRHGARAILEHCARENRLSKNVRGAAQDAELWARFELSRGRPEDALERCWEGLDNLAAEGIEWNRHELELLQARALGWLGRLDQSRELIDEIPRHVLRLLEPEEIPFLFAEAGLLEEALAMAASSKVASLIESVLAGLQPSGRAMPERVPWDQLETLEPFRAARLVYDIELVHPSCAPDSVRRRAAAVLRSRGAEPLADRLDAGRRGPWRALSSYLEDVRPGRRSVELFFEAAGYGGTSLHFENVSTSEIHTVVPGVGGQQRIAVPVRNGRWMLRTTRCDEVLEAFLRLVSRTMEEPASVRPSRSERPAEVVGESQALVDAWRRLVKLGARDVPILILGETGTGKELAAREIHRASSRSERDLLPVNCAAMSETLILSDLFGHAKGSFTGADRDRAGIFESARGGTVFLDEVGDLPLTVQGMLLRVLQEGEIRRLGESHTRRVDVRVVAATHRDLEERVQAETFREDLFYRLNVGRVHLPPLRDRGGDVRLLAVHFLKMVEPRFRFSDGALARLEAHPWPGNVRQLRGVIDGAVAMVDGGESVIHEEHLDLPSTATSRAPYHEWLDEIRRQRIREELERCGGNQAAAARRLGLSRQALSYLVRQLKLT